jgi:esterase/lipase
MLHRVNLTDPLRFLNGWKRIVVAAADIPDLPPAQFPAERWSARLFTGFGTALDATILRTMQLVVERALLPKPENLAALRASAQETLSEELQSEPGRFFERLEEESEPSRVCTRVHRTLDGGVALRCKIYHEYQPYGFTSFAGNNRSAKDQAILVERWVHEPLPGRGTVLTLHGFTMGNPRIDALATFARHWYKRGLDVALMTLPYHGKRTPPDAYFSGDRFAVPNVSRLSEAVREAIHEIRLVTRWLQSDTGKPVGLLGLSLGGYLAALFASLCDDPDFVILMVPPVCFGDLAWRFFKKTHHYREGVRPALSKQELRAAFRLHSPLAYSMRTPVERALIIAGRGDRIVPAAHPSALWEHWQGPAIHWFSGSHLAPFGRRQMIDAVVRHLRRLDVL